MGKAPRTKLVLQHNIFGGQIKMLPGVGRSFATTSFRTPVSHVGLAFPDGPTGLSWDGPPGLSEKALYHSR